MDSTSRVSPRYMATSPEIARIASRATSSSVSPKPLIVCFLGCNEPASRPALLLFPLRNRPITQVRPGCQGCRCMSARKSYPERCGQPLHVIDARKCELDLPAVKLAGGWNDGLLESKLLGFLETRQHVAGRPHCSRQTDLPKGD